MLLVPDCLQEQYTSNVTSLINIFKYWPSIFKQAQTVSSDNTPRKTVDELRKQCTGATAHNLHVLNYNCKLGRLCY